LTSSPGDLDKGQETCDEKAGEERKERGKREDRVSSSFHLVDVERITGIRLAYFKYAEAYSAEKKKGEKVRR